MGRVWVRAQYANELAVVATWLCALLPWSVSVDVAGRATLLEVRFAFAFVRYLFGVPGGTVVATPVRGTAVYAATDPFVAGYRPWLAALAVLALAFALSVALYVREDRTAARLRSPLRAFGVLLGLSGVLFAAAAWEFRRYPGVLVPLGVPVQVAFAAVLLTADVRDRDDPPS